MVRYLKKRLSLSNSSNLLVSCVVNIKVMGSTAGVGVVSSKTVVGVVNSK